LSTQIKEELSRIFTDLQDFLITDINQPFRKFFYPFTGAETIQLKKAKRLREIFIAIINERKASDESYSDLLDMLLKSKYEDTGEAMTNEQIVDEVLILIFAGHETTANTLSWLLYLLSINKETVQKLTDSFKGSTIQECLNNEYLKATINEAMRLYPAAWMTERAAIEDDQFGQFSFPKNTIIISFFFGLHRSESLWPEPLKFKPERFISDASAIRSKNYFPFGAGPRMCIGNNFAMAEMSFFLFSFLKEFQIKPTEQIPEMKPLITLRPDKVLLNIERNDQ
jgi:cytochrome P450